MRYALILTAMIFVTNCPAQSAELDGIILPDRQQVGGVELRLNGIALRTYSIVQIHIYVAGLYLVHPSSNADQILQSADTKLLEIRFVRDISAEQARNAWREGFDQNCLAPCQLAPSDVKRFLAAVPAMHKGDSFSLVFTATGAEVAANGRRIGSINQPQFARLMLATFIGAQPPTPRLKRELLGYR